MHIAKDTVSIYRSEFVLDMIIIHGSFVNVTIGKNLTCLVDSLFFKTSE